MTAGLSENRSRDAHSVAGLIFLILLLTYFITARGHVAVKDTAYSIRTAQALIERGSLQIEAAPEESNQVFETSDGRKYSKYGVGYVLLLLPYAAASKCIAAVAEVPEDLITGFIISFANIPFGAGTGALMFLLARHFGAPAIHSLCMALILGLATLNWSYSVWDFSEAAQCFFLTATTYGLLRNSRKSCILAGCCCAFLILIKVMYLVLLPVFVLFIALKNYQQGKRVLFCREFQFGSFAALGVALLLALNAARYGDLFETGYGGQYHKVDPSRFSWAPLMMLFSLERGLFIYSPVCIAGVLALPFFAGKHSRAAALFLLIILLQLTITSMWRNPGWAWGPRFLVPVLPLILLPALWLFKWKAGRLLMISLAGLSTSIEFTHILQSDHEYHHVVEELKTVDPEASPPPDIVGIPLLLWQKLTNEGNRYEIELLDGEGDGVIETYDYEAYRGFNLWYAHLARHFQMPIVNFIPLTIAPFIIFCFMLLLRKTKRLEASP